MYIYECTCMYMLSHVADMNESCGVRNAKHINVVLQCVAVCCSVLQCVAVCSVCRSTNARHTTPMLRRPIHIYVYIHVCMYMLESCRSYGWVTSHIFMSHVTHMNESCRTYECVMSHIWMSHVAHLNEACRTYGWVMSHIWMSHVAHMNKSCRTNVCCQAP